MAELFVEIFGKPHGIIVFQLLAACRTETCGFFYMDFSVCTFIDATIFDWVRFAKAS